MRSRMVREGSVGLFILLGLSIFGGLILWLRGYSLGKQSYKVMVEFPDIAGVQVGASVRYRGVNVGKVTNIKPNTNGVEATIEITSPEVAIPRDGLLIEALQSGLIGETYVEMKPLKPLPLGAQGIRPLSSNCNTNLIVCDNSRLQGQSGPSLDQLLRSATRVADIFSDPKLSANVNSVAQKTGVAADEVTQLSRNLSGLTRSAQQELTNLSGSVNSVSRTFNQTASQAGLALNQFSGTANQLSNTANKYGTTADQLNQLIGNANTLVQRNRSTLESTLGNFSVASREVVGTVNSLKSTLTQVNSTVGRFNSTKLVNNLEILSANAATASTDAAKAAGNLRNFTTGLNTLNTRENLVQLQKTLDSAQTVFENARKITSDLDELTGDPAFRNNVRNLVNGLGKLVSSTQQLEQQAQVANLLSAVSEKINTTTPKQVAVSRPLFSKNYQAPTPVVPLPISQSAPLSGDRATHTLRAGTIKQLKPLPQHPSSPSQEEWFVPDDQPESED